MGSPQPKMRDSCQDLQVNKASGVELGGLVKLKLKWGSHLNPKSRGVGALQRGFRMTGKHECSPVQGGAS